MKFYQCVCVLVRFHSFRVELRDGKLIFSKEGEDGAGPVCPMSEAEEMESLCEKSEALGLTTERADEHQQPEKEEEELQVKAR